MEGENCIRHMHVSCAWLLTTATQSGTWRLIRSIFIGGCSILGLPARTTTAMQKDILLFLSFHFSFFFLSSVCHHSGYLADSECADLARCAPKTYLNWTSNSNILWFYQSKLQWFVSRCVIQTSPHQCCCSCVSPCFRSSPVRYLIHL
jgi:hypothetical protein